MPENSVLLGQLAEEFTAKVRAGQMPQIEDYARQHPELSERIRALFPTLLFLEGMAAGKPANGSAAATVAPGGGPADFAAGQMFNQYRIERELGRGGMGVVYEAVHLPLSKRVALKVLPLLAGSGASHLERFLREAQTAAGLHHTNIVPVFDIGQSNNMPYYAMQYIEGRGLDRVLAESPAEFGPPHSAGFFRRVGQLGIQAADALAYAHDRGVIHRDIKPSNLLLDKQGVLWITDFGLARRRQDVALTHSGALVGTPRYMSPEQADASRCPIDHRTDVYSLGVTLYELATSRPPFSGKTPAEVVLQIIGREPIPPRRLDPAIPRDLETIILKAMAKQPGDRYQTAAELSDDLRCWLNLEPIKARRIGPVGRGIRWCRRNPRLAAVSAAAAVIILALSSFYYAHLVTAKAAAEEALEVAKTERGKATDALQDAEKQRDNARTAGDQAKDSLARSLYDQARLLLTSRQPGRRWLVLDHLKEAEKLRGRARANPAAKPSADLPSRAELRDKGVAALLMGDARVVSRIETGFGRPAVTGDGRRAAVMWIDPSFTKGAIRMLDLQDGKLLSQWNVACGMTLAMRPDGKVLAAAQEQPPSITLRECSTGKPLSTLVLPPSVKPAQLAAPGSLTFSPDGGYLAFQAFQGKDLVLWDVRDPGHPKTAVAAPGYNNPPALPAFAFNSNGNVLAYVSREKTVRLWEYQSSNKPTEIALPQPIAGALAFGDNDRLLALGPGIGGPTGSKRSVLIWDLLRNREKVRVELEQGQLAGSSAFSPDGKRLAIGTLELGGDIVVYDVTTGNEVMRMESAHTSVVALLQWQKGGKHLVSAGLEGTIKIWELAEPGIQTSLESGAKGIQAFAFSPDGKWLAVCDDKKTRLINRATAELVHEWSGSGQQLLFRSDGRQLAVLGAGLVLAWNFDSGKEVIHLQSKDWKKGKLLTTGMDASYWSSAAFNTEGYLLVAGMQDKRLGVWEAAAAKPRWQAPSTGQRLAFLSTDGRWLMDTPGSPYEVSKPILIRESLTGREVSELPSPTGARPIGGLFSPNSLWLTTSYWTMQENRLFLWKLPAGERHVVASARLLVFANSFSPDNKLLAVNSPSSGAVEFWEVEKAERLFSWPTHSRGDARLAFTPDSSSLVTCDSESGALQMLNLPKLRSQLAEVGLDW